MSPSHRRRRPSYVIDTSTLCRGIRAFFNPAKRRPAPEDNPAAALLEAWQKDDPPGFEWVYSEEILDEYKDVLNRLNLEDLYIGQVIGTIRRRGTSVSPEAGPLVSPDPADDKFYAAALAAGGAAIVTSNPSHFPQAENVRVLSPEEAVAGLV